MHFQYTSYIIPLIAAAAISAWIAVYAWQRRSTRGARALSFLAIAITEWSIGYTLELAGADLATKLFWGKIQYFAIAFVPVIWLIFTVNNSNRAQPLSHRNEVLLSIIPAITLGLALTAGSNRMIWTEFHIKSIGSFSALGVTYGPWFWVHSVYSYLLLLAGAVFLLRGLGNRQRLYRQQAAGLLVAALAPWIGNFLYLSGMSPVPHLDLTPFAFTLTVVALTWSIFGFRLIELAPVARDLVVEEMSDGMIVLDTQDRIADINPAAQRMIGVTANQAIGRSSAEALSLWPHLIEHYGSVMEAVDEITVGEGDEKRWYELQLSPLNDRRKKNIGRVIILRNISERKRAEERIEQLSRAVEASPTSIVITGTDGRIQYTNPKFTQVTGYSGQEALGSNSSILKTDQTPPEVHRQLWETITSGREWRGEFCNRKKNGELYWESASISPITDSTGKIAHYVAVKEDITEQRQVREQLRQKNEYLSVLHQITLDLLDHRELDNLLQAVVYRASALLNAPFGEIMLKEGEQLVVRSTTHNQSFVAGARLTRAEARLSWQAHDTGKPVVLEDYSAWPEHRAVYNSSNLRAVAEFPVMAGDQCMAVLALGRSRPGDSFKQSQIEIGVLFSQLVALVLDNANLYQSALQEIAERKRAETLLQESETRYRQIVENASDIIYRTDCDGHFTYANPMALRIMGLSSDAGIHVRHYSEMATPEWRAELEEFYQWQLENQETNTYCEFPSHPSNGREVWLGQNLQLIKEGERVVGYQAVARDITEIKRAQEALSLARDQALEASRLKSQLLAKVSHELRTPLGGILGYSELLFTNTFGELTEEQKQVTGKIIDSSHYLNNIINELLDQAQMEARKLTMRQDPCAPREILGRVEANMSVLAQKKGLALITSVAPELPDLFLGDEQRLQQIMTNLVGNAIKFTQSGEVRVNLYCLATDYWAIQVCDTGAGVPKEAQAYIFEPFRQVDNSITRENRGTGLGLSITHQLIELMGGHISLESEVGAGSKFTVILPVVRIRESVP